MKKAILFFVVVFALSGCKKEYTCSNGSVYKNGTIQYEQLKRGEIITDYNGQEIHCY
jgi:hypothetical protein